MTLEDHAGVHARVQAVEGSRYTGTQVVIVERFKPGMREDQRNGS